MNFFLDETKFNNCSVILHKDLSFGIANQEVWDFQISIESYPILLMNFDYDLKSFVGFEGYLFLNKCVKKRLYFNVIKKGSLKLDSLILSKDAYGTTYNLKNKTCYYDDISRIFAIGNITHINDVLEIGNGQYVKIQDGEIITLFIKFL